ncbi:hypothetical protein FG379_000049 [Cryptosporidium bovis]|uniref:uncharacterized protein n=1 Tax=Cryptosporidium bovis TaxID=310047 RepID=UPI00351A566E|nr:hypothetical protein FG379_000049 [Cryptosporidium bovis]
MERERLEFLYNPKALSEYDNEKYLLGENIPEDKSKILGEYSDNGVYLDSREGDCDDIDDKEILNRLREDPLLIIKKIELKHKKINEEYHKKKSELTNLISNNIIEGISKDKTTVKTKRPRRRTSFSRSPERLESMHSHYNVNNKSSNYKASKSEKLLEMMEYSKNIQKERINKYINSNKDLPKKSNHFYNSPYLRGMINEINDRRTGYLSERPGYMRGNGG